MFRRFLKLACCCLAFLPDSTVHVQAETPASNIGKRIPDFQLRDTAGRMVSLADFKNKKAIAVLFIGTECPINNTYMPQLKDLHKEFAEKGVQFLAINSNQQDNLQRVAEHAQKNKVPFPVLKDENSLVADLFGARRTPEAFLLGADNRIQYQGRIDDQYGVGYQKPKPTRRDLAEAVTELLAGAKVSRPTSPVAGCIIARPPRIKDQGPVTFAKHVAPVLQRHCQECHRPGQIGPMSLLTYEDATNWSETIREVLQDNRMPPWYADPRYGHFSNDRRLPMEERNILLKWLDNGTPKGDAKDLPPAREFVAGWTIGKPDVILTMPKQFSVPAKMPLWGVPYQNITVATEFKEDRWVQLAEAKPGATSVVHHIVVFILYPGETFNPDNPKNRVLCGTAPGDMPLILPPGMGKKVPAGSKLVLQMHYTPNGTAQKDRSSIGLIFCKKPPSKEVHTVPIVNFGFRIPPGADNYELESSYSIKENAQILAFMPHMHLRGKDFTYEAIYADGKKEILLSVPRYNFNWQSAYRLKKPLHVPKGTKIHCVAHFDNSDKNPNNPNPKKAVFWGDQTWEEMMIGWMDFAYEPKTELTENRKER